MLDPTLYVASPAYLAPKGIFLSVGPQGTQIGLISRFVWKVLLQPSFLGGVKRKWKLIAVEPDRKKNLEPLAKFIEEGVSLLRDFVGVLVSRWVC